MGPFLGLTVVMVTFFKSTLKRGRVYCLKEGKQRKAVYIWYIVILDQISSQESLHAISQDAEIEKGPIFRV